MRRGEGSYRNGGWSEDNSGTAASNGNGNHRQEPLVIPPVRSRPAAVPGRPRKRLVTPPTSTGAPKKKKKKTFCQRFYARWIGCKKRSTAEKKYMSLLIAVLLWYGLGVCSIATSKMLLTGNVPPLYLTLQQLFMGSCFFQFLLNMRAFGTAGLQPWPVASPTSKTRSKGQVPRAATTRQSSFLSVLPDSWLTKAPDLILAGLFFALGFLTTNYSFHESSAAFVETIKAAEPITSAAVAVSWGIETLGGPEVVSLVTIVMGVLISTLANGSSEAATASSSTSSLSSSFRTCLLIMATNLCFSFRGLHQKLFRASAQGAVAVVDDLNLQYRMQQVGVFFLLVPTIALEGPGIITNLWRLQWTYGFRLIQSGVLLRFLSLSIVNGFAFASYNLASTYILTRISVVHHAALNCIRRIFAIVVTAIYFGIPITWFGAFGILISFVGFMSFTHYKVKRQREPRPLSSLLPMSAV